jgi:hypothetical protein
MAVIAHFLDGTTQTFPGATTATNRDPMFTVARYDKGSRRLVEVASFMSKNVTVAEVSELGRGTSVIAGSGRRASS